MPSRRRKADTVTLGDVGEILRGVTYKKADAIYEPAEGYLPLLRATNIGDRLDFDNPVYVPDRLVKDQQRLRVGDILIASSSGSLSVVGKSAVVEQACDATFGAFCTVFRPDERLVDARYVGFFMSSPWYRDRVSRLAKGININNLKRDDISGIPLPMVPLNEQRAVVENLSTLTEGIARGVAALQRASRLGEQFRHAVLSEAVRGPWKHVKLKDVLLSLRNGIFVSRPAAAPPGVRIFRISAVRPMQLNVEDIRYAPVTLLRQEDFVVSPGDLLFTRYSGNPQFVGTCARVPDGTPPTLHPDKLIRGVVDQAVADPAYLELACSAGPTLDEIRARRKTTAGQVGIAGRELGGIPVPLPPLEAQRHIVHRVRERLQGLSELQRGVEAGLRRAETLRRATLAQAFDSRCA